MRVSKGLKQAYDVQDFAYATLMAMQQSLSKDGKLNVTRDDATAISHLVRAWQAAQERIRIHRNKPLPGTVKAQARPSKAPAFHLPLISVEEDAQDQSG